jgi:site-specific recombinase XerD
MEEPNIRQTVHRLGKWLEEMGYAPGTLNQFKATSNQLVKFMDSEGIREFNMRVGLDFLRKNYKYDSAAKASQMNAQRHRFMCKISEFQLHGTPMIRAKNRFYSIPGEFRDATERFLAYRRFEGIVESNIGTINLYLERFFVYLKSQAVNKIPEINITHLHGFLRYLTGYSNPTKNQTMRTIKQFLGFCFKNGFYLTDLSERVPSVHYNRLARIPSAYTYDEVMKLLATVDRANPIGKRNYAVLLLIARLGVRCGDVCRLTFDNIEWEKNLISFTQHKTGNPLTLPLLEDVGLAIIDYLKFGRPKCAAAEIFVRHTPPVGPFTSMYMLVSDYIGKAGLSTTDRKHGPHALRHSLASRLLEENIPLPVISEILGHTNTNTTAAYLSIDIDKLRSCALEV